jgi:hypothetical protein
LTVAFRANLTSQREGQGCNVLVVTKFLHSKETNCFTARLRIKTHLLDAITDADAQRQNPLIENREEDMRNDKSLDSQRRGRRDFLGAAFAACAITPPTSLSLVQLSPNMSHSLTKEERGAMTPAQVIEELKKGNERFRMRKMAPGDYVAEKRASAAGQYPAAVVLGCLDSRVPRLRATS